MGRPFFSRWGDHDLAGGIGDGTSVTRKGQPHYREEIPNSLVERLNCIVITVGLYIPANYYSC